MIRVLHTTILTHVGSRGPHVGLASAISQVVIPFDSQLDAAEYVERVTSGQMRVRARPDTQVTQSAVLIDLPPNHKGAT